MFSDFQPLAAIATTPHGARRLQAIAALEEPCWVPASVSLANTQTYTGALKDHVAALWPHQRSFVFCLAVGAVVRLIAPLLRDKATDPAVVVVDEAGQYVISLCGGHQGGGDRLAQALARQLGATPILTGASNYWGLPGADVLGQPFGWGRGPGDWTGVSSAIARQGRVQVIQQAGSTLWQAHLPEGHGLELVSAPGSAAEGDAPEARLRITAAVPTPADRPEAWWHPRVLWVGVGCERGTPRSLIEQAVSQTCAEHGLAEGAIAGLATLDLKADEVGLVELSRDRPWPLRCFSVEELRGVPVPTPSEVVAAEVGTPSVAEAAALVAARQAQAWLPDLPEPQLRVTKQIVRAEGVLGAVTVAIAESALEMTGRRGQLWLVGTGPGSLDQITPAAQTAITQADVVIGYSLYVDLVRPLLRTGQIVEALPITQEKQRAQRAIALAQWGLTVAVISSGDCGIYGMAGLVLEELRAGGWDGQTPRVQVFPGVTALQAAASRVGAPLMHDFCAISLSDLLTPWPVIEKRLGAAAAADFVTALYNPRSRTRTDQIVQAQQIFLAHRSPETPVALVQSAYRPEERVTLTTLGQMLEQTIDMLTVVLIGNSSGRTYEGWFITPRGYLGFDPDQAS